MSNLRKNILLKLMLCVTITAYYFIKIVYNEHTQSRGSFLFEFFIGYKEIFTLGYLGIVICLKLYFPLFLVLFVLLKSKLSKTAFYSISAILFIIWIGLTLLVEYHYGILIMHLYYKSSIPFLSLLILTNLLKYVTDKAKRV